MWLLVVLRRDAEEWVVPAFVRRLVLTLLDPGVVKQVEVNWVQLLHLYKNLLKHQEALCC